MGLLAFKICVLLSLFINTFHNAQALQTQVECQLQPWERIITDYEIMELGVSVDYSYNETRVNSSSAYKFGADDNATISAPGCPKSIDGIPWLHYGDPPKCYVPGYRGPCEYYEVLLQESRNSTKAYCACLTALDDNLEMMQRSDDGKYVFNNHSDFGIYNPQNKKCYDLYSQGPCEEGHIFIRFSNSTTLKCVPQFHGTCSYNLESQICEKRDTNPYGNNEDIDSAPLIPHECNSNEKYSTLLNRCIRKRQFHGVQIG